MFLFHFLLRFEAKKESKILSFSYLFSPIIKESIYEQLIAVATT